jgi:hypothetical protein
MSEYIVNYIYLLQEREFIKTNENIYKIGMTKQKNSERFNQYPKGSILLFQMACNDCVYLEKQLLTIFKDTFIQRKDIGNEYFEGNCTQMNKIICYAIYNEQETTDNEKKPNISITINKKEEKKISINKKEENINMDDDDTLKTNNLKKQKKKHICYICNFENNKMYSYNQHLKSKKHINAMNIIEEQEINKKISNSVDILKNKITFIMNKINCVSDENNNNINDVNNNNIKDINKELYCCNICDYNTSRKYNYKLHLNSVKHKKN